MRKDAVGQVEKLHTEGKKAQRMKGRDRVARKKAPTSKQLLALVQPEASKKPGQGREGEVEDRAGATIDWGLH